VTDTTTHDTKRLVRALKLATARLVVVEEALRELIAHGEVTRRHWTCVQQPELDLARKALIQP
jgi:hypothetical protein